MQPAYTAIRRPFHLQKASLQPTSLGRAGRDAAVKARGWCATPPADPGTITPHSPPTNHAITRQETMEQRFGLRSRRTDSPVNMPSSPSAVWPPSCLVILLSSVRTGTSSWPPFASNVPAVPPPHLKLGSRARHVGLKVTGILTHEYVSLIHSSCTSAFCSSR